MTFHVKLLSIIFFHTYCKNMSTEISNASVETTPLREDERLRILEEALEKMKAALVLDPNLDLKVIGTFLNKF